MHGLLWVAVAFCRIKQRRRYLLRSGVKQLWTIGAIRELLAYLRGRDDQIRGIRRSSSNPHQALAEDALITQHAQEPGAVEGGIRQLAVIQQPSIRVGGLS